MSTVRAGWPPFTTWQHQRATRRAVRRTTGLLAELTPTVLHLGSSALEAARALAAVAAQLGTEVLDA